MGMKIIGIIIVAAILVVCFAVMSKFSQENENCEEQGCDGNCASCAKAMSERYEKRKKEDHE
ncbi:MAG: hypothetical protein K6G01_05395 [Eubacterium sp.]|nr:hypothetical protein [Eubacterium sp.]